VLARRLFDTVDTSHAAEVARAYIGSSPPIQSTRSQVRSCIH
jgi:hypothetical protein